MVYLQEFWKCGLLLGRYSFKRKLNIDDSLDCWGIHGIGGIIGAITIVFLLANQLVESWIIRNFMQYRSIGGCFKLIFYSGLFLILF